MFKALLSILNQIGSLRCYYGDGNENVTRNDNVNYDQIEGFVENVSTRRYIFQSLFKLERSPHVFRYWIVRPHCTT